MRLIGQTAAICQLRQTIERVAVTDLSLLVLGENGTGKEVVSQMVHYLSERRDEPLIAVNLRGDLGDVARKRTVRT